ncbi:probable aldo-keto reductase 1 [Gossypium raimondii]|uniref:probable aldo-keto reductase 1 n=1 Tax=Gossypium raimondii TaxID=29730 RepID=UPI002279F726|nr:probable aldo-keto reductase 1 [Gossypium raimondii]
MVDEQQRVQIPRVKLGTQGLEGLGVWVFLDLYDPVSDDVGIMIIKHAFEEGITFFDTTDLYGHKTNEILVEKTLKQLPQEKVQLATKFGVESIGPGGLVVSGTPEYVCASLESSLKRLDVDYIDLYYIIRVDTKTPIEETVNHPNISLSAVFSEPDQTGWLDWEPADTLVCNKAKNWLIRKLVQTDGPGTGGLTGSTTGPVLKTLLVGYILSIFEWKNCKKLVEEGKIKYIGISEASPETIRRAHAVHPITAVQMEWALWTHDIEEEVVPLCRGLGIGIVPYSPLGQGFSENSYLIDSLTDYKVSRRKLGQKQDLIFESREVG